MTVAADTGLFPPGAVIRRVDSEGVLLLGGGRALLLQLAHPSVAAGVDSHSDFRTDPFKRLQRTLEVTTTIVFGTTEQALQAADALTAVHDTVTGPGYRANDPDLLLWVHATLVDTALRVHRRFLGPLSPADAEAYYADNIVLGEVLGIPRQDQPPDLAAFRAYVRDTVGDLASGLTEQSRRLGREVLQPKLPLVAGPLVQLGREVTAGLLPDPLRRAYGLPWDPIREAAFNAACLSARQVLPRLPKRLRRLPTG